jgi:tetratricopeptide (TPR) repeat protein
MDPADDYRLPLHCRLPRLRQHVFAALTLTIAVLLVYGNSFHAAWHLDDVDAIVHNPHVHADNLTYRDLTPALRGMRTPGGGGNGSRPLAYLSFAVNHAVGSLNVFGYHVVNVALHLLNAMLLYLICRGLLGSPALRGRYAANEHSVALIAAFLWALHPLHVSTVTYIVQRMAVMAGFFSLVSICCYLKSRGARKTVQRRLWMALAVVAGGMGLAAKETVILLPGSMLLIEWLLFTPAGASGRRRMAAAVAGYALSLALLFVALDVAQVLSDGYRHRPFSLGQRLLTQPRVMFLYLGLLLMPSSGRLMLLHDIDPSRSILTPWTTMPALFGLGLVLALAIGGRRRAPLCSLAVLFFLYNHLIESTVLPLEMVFEHRNYTPALFLFLPIGAALVDLLAFFAARRRHWSMGLGALTLGMLLFSHGHSVWLRNRIFATELSLWQENARQAPRLKRPWLNLAKALMDARRPDESLTALAMALQAPNTQNRFDEALIWLNFGEYCLASADLGSAAGFFRKSIDSGVETAAAWHGLAKLAYLRGDERDMDQCLQRAQRLAPGDAGVWRSRSLLLLRQARTREAIRAALHSLTLAPDTSAAWYIIGEAWRISGRPTTAARWFQRYRGRHPQDANVFIALADCYLRLGRHRQLERLCTDFFRNAPRTVLWQALRDYNQGMNLASKPVEFDWGSCTLPECRDACAAAAKEHGGADNAHRMLVQGARLLWLE